MRVSFRQGIVEYKHPKFIQVDFPYVNLIADNTSPLLVNIASTTSDYLHIEKENVSHAWGPIRSDTDIWLYIDIDIDNARRTFGFTYFEPLVGAITPISPVISQHWFDTTINQMKVWIGDIWIPKIRIFVCKLQRGAIPISISINSPYDFSGTQIGDNSSVLAGYILFDKNNNPVRSMDDRFTTSETTLKVTSMTPVEVQLSSDIMEAMALYPFPAYTFVEFYDFDKIKPATAFNILTNKQYGIVQTDANTTDKVNVYTAGLITNPDWNWTINGMNAYLYNDNNGIISPIPTIPDQQPVAIVVGSKTIKIVTKIVITTLHVPNTAVATTTTFGTILLNIPPIDDLYPVVVGSNDIRLTDNRHPLAHTHPISDVVNLQTNLNTKLNLAGGTLTGDLILHANPTVNLGAATKQYVDNIVLDSISDVTLTTPSSGQLLTYDGSKWINSTLVIPPQGVTSVDLSGGTTGLTTSGGPITTSGTISLTGTLATTNGGTGLTTIGTSLQVLRTNTGATALEWATPALTTPGGTPFSASSTVIGDPNYGDVVLLLQGNGTNNSITMVDSSVYVRAVTRIGNPIISTTQSKFENSSIYFDGIGSALTIVPSAELQVAGKDFTIETWARFDGVGGPDVICFFNQYSPGIYDVSISQYAGNLYCNCDTVNLVTSNTPITPNIWYHIALVRNGNNVRLYLNGTSVLSATYSGTVGVHDRFTIGGIIQEGNTFSIMKGYLDDFRFTNGAARYTTTFTPPIYAAPTTSDSWLNSPIQFNDNGTFNGSNYLMWDNAHHFLGVNNSTPLVQLDVVGNIAATGTLTLGTPLTITNGGTSADNAVTAINNLVPVQTGKANNFLMTDGFAVKWGEISPPTALFDCGYNVYGQLGNNTTNTISISAQVGASISWKTVSCGDNHTIALGTDGTLWAWGGNWLGQLGLGNTTGKSTPTQVGSLTNWKQVSAGEQFSLAVKTDGTLWAWGEDAYGKLGDGASTNRSSPIQIGLLTNWKQVSCGNNAAVAVKTDGTLWTWGYNGYGQLGNGIIGNGTQKSSPIQIGNLTNWSVVSSGDNHVIAVKTDGTLWAWGANYSGAVGNENTTNQPSPVQIGSLTNWKQISGGGYYSAAVKTDGTLWAWGVNDKGQMGDGTQINKSSPVQIGTASNWSSIKCGMDHTIAAKTDGTLWGWGNNTNRALGITSALNYVSIPIQIDSLVASAQIACGQRFSLFLRSINGGVLIPIECGGTGQTTITTAINALLPSQTGNNGKTLSTDGSNISWQVAASPLTTLPYDIAFYIDDVSTIDINTRVSGFLSPRAATITDGVGNVAKCQTAATGIDTIFSILKNGVQFATVTFVIGSTTGTIVFTAGSPVSIVAGDFITLKTGATKDGTIADIGITFVGVSPII